MPPLLRYHIPSFPRRLLPSFPHQARSYATPTTSTNHVRLVEVGPRDGLQNEATSIPLETKLELIRRLAMSGVTHMEAGSFVPAKWVPQMASTNEIFQELLSNPPPSPSPTDYNYLVPNMRGLENMQKLLEGFQSTSTSKDTRSEEQVVENAPITSSQNPSELPSRELSPSPSPSQSQSSTSTQTKTAPITSTADPNDMPSASPFPSSSSSSTPLPSISLFAAATESFSQANTNTSIASSLTTCQALTSYAKSLRPHPLRVRGYISVALGCPYDGPDAVPPQRVASMTATLLSMGCDEVSIADTTGMGTPHKTLALLRALAAEGIDPSRGDPIALHFHDTYGQALVNTMVALEQGVRVFDSSVGGLGGCPYSKGATGNVSTEDLAYLLAGLGMDTDVQLDQVAEVGEWISGVLGRRNEGRAGKAMLARLRG